MKYTGRIIAKTNLSNKIKVTIEVIQKKEDEVFRNVFNAFSERLLDFSDVIIIKKVIKKM